MKQVPTTSLEIAESGSEDLTTKFVRALFIQEGEGKALEFIERNQPGEIRRRMGAKEPPVKLTNEEEAIFPLLKRREFGRVVLMRLAGAAYPVGMAGDVACAKKDKRKLSKIEKILMYIAPAGIFAGMGAGEMYEQWKIKEFARIDPKENISHAARDFMDAVNPELIKILKGSYASYNKTKSEDRGR